MAPHPRRIDVTNCMTANGRHSAFAAIGARRGQVGQVHGQVGEEGGAPARGGQQPGDLPRHN